MLGNISRNFSTAKFWTGTEPNLKCIYVTFLGSSYNGELPVYERTDGPGPR